MQKPYTLYASIKFHLERVKRQFQKDVTLVLLTTLLLVIFVIALLVFGSMLTNTLQMVRYSMVKLVSSKVLRLLKQAILIPLLLVLLSTLLTLLVRMLTVSLTGKIWRLSSILSVLLVVLIQSINVLLSVLKLHLLQRCSNRMLL